MKSIFYSVLFIISAFVATESFAQSSGVVKQSYVLPKTSINISFTVETTSVKIGPYAKFAQQYLGVTAPLNSSNSSRVVSPRIEGYSEGDLSNIYILDGAKEQSIQVLDGVQPCATNSGVATDLEAAMQFNDMGIEPIVYKASMGASGVSVTREKNLEQMAASAAETIFTLRKRRFDLITGELGENVFGAGLEAAIEEMARIEAEYLSLFLGKSSVIFKSYSYDVVPEVGKSSYILARFSKQDGVVGMTDLAAEPIVLTITPEGSVKQQPGVSKPVKGAKKYRVADMAECKLYFSSELLNSRRVGIFQYGATVEL